MYLPMISETVRSLENEYSGICFLKKMKQIRGGGCVGHGVIFS
jgi:hypothetical protein